MGPLKKAFTGQGLLVLLQTLSEHKNLFFITGALLNKVVF